MNERMVFDYRIKLLFIILSSNCLALGYLTRNGTSLKVFFILTDLSDEYDRDRDSGCRNRGHCPSPLFGRSVNPIPTGGGQIIPTYFTAPPQKKKSPSGITVCS